MTRNFVFNSGNFSSLGELQPSFLLSSRLSLLGIHSTFSLAF